MRLDMVGLPRSPGAPSHPLLANSVPRVFSCPMVLQGGEWSSVERWRPVGELACRGDICQAYGGQRFQPIGPEEA